MYKRIYDSEEIVVDYYNDGKPMIRVSQFKDYHWQDEHFVELPEEVEPVVHAHWIPAPDVGDCCYRCSSCGKVIDHYCDEDDMFCSRCGAHMDEEVGDGT